MHLSALAVHQQKGFTFSVLTTGSEGAGANFEEVGPGRGKGEKKLTVIIYFTCLHLLYVVPSLNRNRIALKILNSSLPLFHFLAFFF